MVKPFCSKMVPPSLESCLRMLFSCGRLACWCSKGVATAHSNVFPSPVSTVMARRKPSGVAPNSIDTGTTLRAVSPAKALPKATSLLRYSDMPLRKPRGMWNGKRRLPSTLFTRKPSSSSPCRALPSAWSLAKHRPSPLANAAMPDTRKESPRRSFTVPTNSPRALGVNMVDKPC